MLHGILLNIYALSCIPRNSFFQHQPPLFDNINQIILYRHDKGKIQELVEKIMVQSKI